MVRHAFRVLTRDGVATRILCFSDDMDGFRKVPDNVPNREMMESHLGKPLSRIPDPFSNEYPSFGAANNARLRAFLDRFGFDYEFASATDYYTSGRFDEALLRMLAVYDEVMAIILPTLGEERRATYSPFLPVCKRTGKVLQVPMIARDPQKGTITYADPETGEQVETGVTGGQVKCQWKADWALRWFALGVDYEMAGKDLIDSVNLSSKICRALGGRPPEGFNYELFLDENGQKISKSKGNGLTIDEWLTYASTESLGYYMFQKPRTAKRLYFDVIPKAVDEYHQQLRAYHAANDPEKRLANPVWHIHGGNPPESHMVVPFAMLLNLASVAGAKDKSGLWGFIKRYAPEASPEANPDLDQAAEFAVRYFRDFVAPTRAFRAPDAKEKAAMEDLVARLKTEGDTHDPEELQNVVYAVGREHGFEPLRDWFRALYEVCLGASQGPRFGGFIALYGVAESIALIEAGIAGKLG
jgi:lysyl-tRNA synthetase class 1